MPAQAGEPDALAQALVALNPDEMSPREALEALYALKLKAAKKGA
jgi:DNA mismatch repair protein MutS